jgi:hypothetical protein
MMVDGEWVEVEHDEARGFVRIRHPKVNGGEWLEETSLATAGVKTRHDLYAVVRRMFRQK